jgi:membrane-associated protease RseP (regulator of RpoE activity)
MNGITTEILDHRFEESNDLTPSAALQEESKRNAETMSKIDFSKIDFSKAKPRDPTKPPPFPGPPRPTYGFTYAPVTDKLEIRLMEIYPGSPADKAGLRRGDVIIAFGEQKLADFPDRKALFAFMGQKNPHPGDFTIQRGEETFKVHMEKVDSTTFAPPESP